MEIPESQGSPSVKKPSSNGRPPLKRSGTKRTKTFHFLNVQKKLVREYASLKGMSRNWRLELHVVSDRGVNLAATPSSDWTQYELDALYKAWRLRRPKPSELRQCQSASMLVSLEDCSDGDDCRGGSSAGGYSSGASTYESEDGGCESSDGDDLDKRCTLPPYVPSFRRSLLRMESETSSAASDHGPPFAYGNMSSCSSTGVQLYSAAGHLMCADMEDMDCVLHDIRTPPAVHFPELKDIDMEVDDKMDPGA